MSTFATLRRLILFEIIFQLKVTTSNNFLVILQFLFYCLFLEPSDPRVGVVVQMVERSLPTTQIRQSISGIGDLIKHRVLLLKINCTEKKRWKEAEKGPIKVAHTKWPKKYFKAVYLMHASPIAPLPLTHFERISFPRECICFRT